MLAARHGNGIAVHHVETCRADNFGPHQYQSRALLTYSRIHRNVMVFSLNPDTPQDFCAYMNNEKFDLESEACIIFSFTFVIMRCFRG